MAVDRKSGAPGSQLHRIAAIALAIMLVAGIGAAWSLHRLLASRPPAGVAVDPLGVTFAPDVDGAPMLDSLLTGGRADRAGLRVGDRIAAVGGYPVTEPADVTRGTQRHREIALRIVREGRLLNVKLSTAR